MTAEKNGGETKTRILLVEDDPQISKSLSLSLSFSGFEVVTAGSLAQALCKIGETTFDILLLDVGLPDGTGIELCQKIRENGKNTPIIFLSARTDEETVVNGMRTGGDDYIRKPFGIEELKIRMQKVLKRAVQRDLLEAGELKIDVRKRSVVLGDKTLALGKREFDILTLMVKRAGDVVTRDAILHMLEEKPELYDRTIDSHVSHLRRKLRESGNEKVEIVSVYGVGYRLQWKG